MSIKISDVEGQSQLSVQPNGKLELTKKLVEHGKKPKTGFKNVGKIRLAQTGKSLEIQITNGIQIAGGETLYANLEMTKRIIENKATYTSVARRVVSN
jgi:hypothetical protein